MTFSFLTWQQTHHYFNEETFWKYNLEKNPQSWLGHNNLGKWYLDHEQWPLALQHLNQATALNPEYGNAFLNRGTVYLLEGNLEKALEDFNRVLVLNPQSGMAYNNRGLIHFDQQKYAAALLDFNQALHHNPQLIKTLQNRASLHLEVFQNTEAACQDWKALCDLDHCQHLLQAQQGRICP